VLARHVAGEPDAASAVVALAQRQAGRGDWNRTALLLDHAIARGAGHDPVLLALRLRAARESQDRAGEQRFAALLAEVRPAALVAR
jgi:Tfp pilus assembly protein PilF